MDISLKLYEKNPFTMIDIKLGFTRYPLYWH